MISKLFKPKRVSDFAINYLQNCQDSEGRETKKKQNMIWGQLFSFSNFRKFWKFSNRS